MAISDRDIIITPNRGASSEPIITLRGADAASSATMVMRVINSGTVSTLSYEGTSGQLFAVSDTFVGTIFSVNDVSGIPSIEVLDTGNVKLAEWNGKVIVGGINNNENATSVTTGELQVVGGVGVSRDVYVGGGMTVVGTLNAAVIAGSISNAANAANVAVTDDPSNGATMYPTFVSATSGNQAIRTDSNGLVWIPSTNRLGIGTTSPSAQLHVYAATDPYIKVQTGGGSYSYIQLDDSSSSGYLIKNTSSGVGNGALAGALYTYTDNSKAFQHIHSGTPLFTILSTGKTGIGTTAPAGRLHVAGAGNAAGGNITIGEPSNNVAKWSYLVSTHYSAAQSQGFSLIGGYTDATSNRVVIGGSIYESNPATEIQFWTHTATTHSTGGSQRMVIDTNGNVGIGTTAPSTKLHILKSTPTGVAGVPTDTDLLIDSNTNSYLTFRQTNDIGLYGGIQWVDNNVGAYIVFRNFTGSGTAAGSDSLIYGAYQDHIFQAGTSESVNGKIEVARITQAGNMGIGKTVPTTRLHVYRDGLANNTVNPLITLDGKFNVTGVDSNDIVAIASRVENNGGGSQTTNIIGSGYQPSYNTLLLQPSGGNVGINNTNPGRTLDVTGVTNVSSHITQGALISRPNVSWGASGSSTGAVVIKFPGGSGNYGMVHIVIDIYTYDGENASTLIIGGHNWNSAWYNFGASLVGTYSKGVRVAFKDGQYAVVLGTNTSTWSYGQVVVRKIQNGSYYSGIMDLGGTYSIVQDASAESYTYISGNLITAGSAGGGGWNSGNDGNGSGLDADLIDGLDSTAFLRRDVTNTMFAGQTSSLAFENQSTFFRFAFNELRFYDNQNGDIFGLDEHAYATTSMRAPIFYDRNDTGYYTDPASISSMYGVAIRGDTSSTDTSNQIFFWGAGNATTSAIGFKASGGSFGNPTGNGDGYNTYLTMDTPGRGWVFREGVGGTNFGAAQTSGWILNNGLWQANASMRAPIFYDSNDTGRYLDPNGTSILGGLFVAATASTGRSSYGSGTANLVLYAESTYGRATIDFRSGVNYPSDGAQIYYETATNLASGETSRLVIRTENDADDSILLRGGFIQYQSITVDGGSSNPGHRFTYNSTDRLYIYSDNTTETGSFRAPIFYDSNNTGYYADPASTTVLNNLTVNGTLSATISGGSDFARRLDNATRTAISVGGNASTFYPVVLQIGAGATAQQYGEFVLERGGYDDPGYTGVNFSTFNMRMSVKASGWGFGSTYENCEALYQNVQLVANWQQVSESSRLIIWLRGATVYYLWNVVGNTTLVDANAAGGNIVETNPAYYTYTFTPTTTVQPKAQHSKYFNNGTMSDGNSRISSLGIGTNASGTDGRLDVTADIRSPIYYDSNNTAFYTDPNSTSVLSTLRVPGATAGWSLMVGENTTTGVVNDNARYGVVINAPYYPHLYLTSTTDSGNTTHGPVFSMQGILTAGGYRKWNIGIPNRNPNELSFGWADNLDNPHYGVGISWTGPTASMWIDTGHNLYVRNSVRGTIFYDYNDTTYYLDPNSTGTSLNMAGSVRAATHNRPGILSVASGTASTGASFAIQQETGEGWTGIFVDFEPYTGWGLYHDNPNNYFSFTAEATAGGIRSFTVPSRVSGNRTAYEKFRIDQGTGDTITGAIGYANASFRAPIFYDSDNTTFYADPAGTSVFNVINANSINATINGSASSATSATFVSSRGRISAEIGRNALASGVYTFSTYTAANPGGNPPLTYPEIIAWGSGASGSIQLAGDWISTTSTPLRVRSLRDCCQDWSSWSAVATSNESFTNNVDLRAPIFYDSNNTAFYTDPNGISVLAGLNINGGGTNISLRQQVNSPGAGYTFSSGGQAAFWIESPQGDYGGMCLDADGTTIYGAGDSGWVFRVIDEDSYQGFVNNAANAALATCFQVNQSLNGGGYLRGSFSVLNGDITVGTGQTSSNIYMADTDEGQRRIHCNSNRIGFLSQGDAWGSYCGDGGEWYSDQSVRSPIFYDNNDTGYFADPASSSTFRQIRVAAQTQSAQYNNAAIEVREFNYGGVMTDITANYPRIGFHWGGRVASSIAMGTNGWIAIMNNPGTGYENIIAAQGLFTSEVTAYYSDIRLKTRVGNIDNAVEKVKAIETFKYVNNELANSFGFTDTDVHVGVSAQSVEAVLPEVVRHAPFDMKSQDGDTISASGEWYKTVQYDKLVPLLIEAIKEQQSTIDELRAEMQELKELVKQSLGK